MAYMEIVSKGLYYYGISNSQSWKRTAGMERLVRAYYVPEFDTLDLWLDDPSRESESEEVGDGVIAKFDSSGNIIGVEIISASKTSWEQLADLPENIRSILMDSMKKLATAASHIARA